jgi:hypothetical protein
VEANMLAAADQALPALAVFVQRRKLLLNVGDTVLLARLQPFWGPADEAARSIKSMTYEGSIEPTKLDPWMNDIFDLLIDSEKPISQRVKHLTDKRHLNVIVVVWIDRTFCLDDGDIVVLE